MSYSSEKRAMEQRFAAAWNHTPIQWPNVAFNPTTLSEWVRISIAGMESFQASMGDDTNLFRYPGLVAVSIFVRPNSGAKRTDELVDAVCDIWRAAQFNGISMKTPYKVEIGVVDGWYQVNVLCSYQRDSYQSRSV